MEEGCSAAKSLLAKRIAFTALVCFNDMAAIGAMIAFREAGLSVPGQISVVGFDDIGLAAMTMPPLTTVRQPLLDMGSGAARALVKHLEMKTEEFPEGIVFKPELIVRGSSAKAPRTPPNR